MKKDLIRLNRRWSNCTTLTESDDETFARDPRPLPRYSSAHQPTNPPTHQRANSPTHQLTNAPTHQRTNAPTHQRTNSPTPQSTNAPTHLELAEVTRTRGKTSGRARRSRRMARFGATEATMATVATMATPQAKPQAKPRASPTDRTKRKAPPCPWPSESSGSCGSLALGTGSPSRVAGVTHDVAPRPRA